jgi:predicted Abi (CAAX) family protease
MGSRSEQLTALEAGPLSARDLLLLVQKISIWKRRAKWAFVGIAVLVLLCASLLIGYELGILLFSMLQK